MTLNTKNLPIRSQKNILNFRHLDSEIIHYYQLNPDQQLLIETYLEKVHSLQGDGKEFNAYRQKILNEFREVNQNHQLYGSFLQTFFQKYPQVIAVFKNRKIFPFMIDMIKDKQQKYHLVVGTVSGFDLRSLPREMIVQYYIAYESAITRRPMSFEASTAFKNLMDAYYDEDKKPAIFIQLDSPALTDNQNRLIP